MRNDNSHNGAAKGLSVQSVSRKADTVSNVDFSASTKVVSPLSRIDCFHHVEDVRAIWQQLETNSVFTPYHRLDWMAAWYELVCPHREEQPLIAVAYDEHGEPSILLPFVKFKKGPFTFAGWPGDKHANYNTGLFRRDVIERISGAELSVLLTEVGSRESIDAFLLSGMPDRCDGVAPPFLKLENTRTSFDRGHYTRLEPDYDSWVQKRFSTSARKKLRRKERQLAELGAVELLCASDEATIDRLFDVYQSQKGQWFQRRGIANPFQEPGVDAFFRAAAKAGLRTNKPGIEIFALMSGDDVASIIAGVPSHGQFCSMITSMELDRFPAYSPGDLIHPRIIDVLVQRGYSIFDLGVGESNLKRVYCDVEQPLFDAIFTISASGRIAANVWMCKRALRDMMKSNHHVSGAVRVMRAFKARVLGGKNSPSDNLIGE